MCLNFFVEQLAAPWRCITYRAVHKGHNALQVISTKIGLKIHAFSVQKVIVRCAGGFKKIRNVFVRTGKII